MYEQIERPGRGDQYKPARDSQVRSEVSRYGSLIDELTKSISALEERLHLVLRSPGPEPASPDAKGKINPSLVELAGTISTQNDQLARICHQVSEILDRLEL